MTNRKPSPPYIASLDWELRLSVTRRVAISAAKISSFAGDIRTLLKGWPNEVTEADIENFTSLLHKMNALAEVDRLFCSHLASFGADKERASETTGL